MDDSDRYGDHSEIVSLIMVWTTAVASLCYCHAVGKFTSGGGATSLRRPLAILPVVILFTALPLNLTTMSLGGSTAFFLAWLANFKLLQFAFNKGPLSLATKPIPLPQFIALACLPIKAQDQIQNPNQNPGKSHKSAFNYASKFTLLVFVLLAIRYANPNPATQLFLYCLGVYFVLELILATTAVVARGLMRADLEPQFDEPYLATSLQDFWGRRWNLMASKSLRPTIYDPVRTIFNPILGRKWSPVPAVIATFLASGLMHELVLYYIGRLRPTGKLTCFFLLNGVSVAGEMGIKRVLNGRFQLPVVLSRLLTLGFLLCSSFLLFFPPFRRSKADTKSCTEILALIQFLKSGKLVSPSNLSCPFI